MVTYGSFISNNIEIRLTKNNDELNEVLHLRYKELLLSYNDKNTNDSEMFKDEYDDVCDHLIAKDLKTNTIVGTYRLVRNCHLESLNYDSFMTETEFDISKIKNNQLLEISRAVVKEEYRNGIIIMLLWKGLIRYACSHNVKYMFGTASFYGVNPHDYAQALSYIYYNHLSEKEVRAKALESSRCDINLVPSEELDMQVVKKQMPPLVKGYLKIGATFGEDCYLDVPFNSLDVFVLFDVENVNPKYLQKFLES